MKYNFLIIEIIILLMFIVSCKTPSVHTWHVYNARETGLKLKGENFNKMLVGNDVFYLLGSSIINFDSANSKSIVYKSNNYGKNWIEAYNGEGNIVDGYLFSNELFLFKESYLNNSFDNTSLSLINKDTLVHNFKNNSSVKGVFIDSHGRGAVIMNNSFLAKDNTVFRTIDNFKSYDSVHIGKPIKRSRFFNDRVYLLTYELIRENYKVLEKNDIYIINKDGSRDSLQTDFSVEDFFVDTNGIFLIGKHEKGLTFEVITDKAGIKPTIIFSKKNIIPKKLHKYKSFIAVLSSSINEYDSGGFGSSKYQLHLSFDNGKTFQEEKLPIDNFVESIKFYKNEKIIIYSGAGRISVCDLKK